MYDKSVQLYAEPVHLLNPLQTVTGSREGDNLSPPFDCPYQKCIRLLEDLGYWPAAAQIKIRWGTSKQRIGVIGEAIGRMDKNDT